MIWVFKKKFIYEKKNWLDKIIKLDIDKDQYYLVMIMILRSNFEFS